MTGSHKKFLIGSVCLEQREAELDWVKRFPCISQFTFFPGYCVHIIDCTFTGHSNSSDYINNWCMLKYSNNQNCNRFLGSLCKPHKQFLFDLCCSITHERKAKRKTAHYSTMIHGEYCHVSEGKQTSVLSNLRKKSWRRPQQMSGDEPTYCKGYN